MRSVFSDMPVQTLDDAVDRAFFREYSGLRPETREQLRQMAKILGANQGEKDKMNEIARPRPLKEANRITQILDTCFGADRFDRHPVDIAALAPEYSRQIAPASPIRAAEERD